MVFQSRPRGRSHGRVKTATVLSLLACGCRGFSGMRFSLRSGPPTPPSHFGASATSRSRGEIYRTVPCMSSRAGGYGRFGETWEEDESGMRNEWKKVGDADVILPQRVDFPLGVVHFIGGAGVGALPRNTYAAFLEALVEAGFLVVATPLRLNEFDHEDLACRAARDFRFAFREVESYYGKTGTRRVPIFGLGHSLGAKVHTLLNCYTDVRDVAKRRKASLPPFAANVIISFNNYPAKESVPLLGELKDLGLAMGDMSPLGDSISGFAKAVSNLPVMGLAARGLSLAEEWAPKVATAVGDALTDTPQEFKPSPEETWRLIYNEYSVRNNLVIQFRRDTIDESTPLAESLFKRFGRDGELQFSTLDGTHITPNTPKLGQLGRGLGAAQEWERTTEGFGAGAVEGGARMAVEAARRELDDLTRSVIAYLQSQSLWVRHEGRWDNDDM
ncbi:unnamed protein product [Discosporangium mesarthrocarpum]